MTDTDPGAVRSIPGPAKDQPADESLSSWHTKLARLRHRSRLAFDVVVLTLVALVIFLPGFTTIPVTDRDEARIVQATRQMIETGDWIDTRLQAEPHYQNPIGIHWLQGIAVLASGEGADAPVWVYRIPSLVGAVAAVLLTYSIGVGLGAANVGLAAALLATATIGLGIEARIAKTDGALLATILAAQWALAAIWMDPARRRQFGRNLVFWVALGFGILVKGPVILLVSGLALAVLLIADRSLALLKALSPLKGLGVMLAIVAPWLIAIGIVSEGRFFVDLLGHDMLAYVVTGQASHGAPPGTHMAVAFGTFWPLAAFLPLALVHAVRRSSEKPFVFLLAWIVPGWVVFEIIATKLPNQVLPFMPGLAILAALTILDGALNANRTWRRVTLGWIALGAVILAVGLNAGFVFLEQRAHPLGIAWAIVAGLAGIVAWRLVIGPHPFVGVLATTAAAGLTTALGFGLLLPSAGSLWLSERLAAAVAVHAPCPEPTVVSVGYIEPSLLFRTEPPVRFADVETAADVFKTASCAVVILPAESRAEFVSRTHADVAPVATVEGRNVIDLAHRRMEVFVIGGP